MPDVVGYGRHAQKRHLVVWAKTFKIAVGGHYDTEAIKWMSACRL